MQKYSAMLRPRGASKRPMHPSAAVALALGLMAAGSGCAHHSQTGAASGGDLPPPQIQSESAVPQPVASMDQAQDGAGDLSLRREAPLRYVVKRGDTLWSIANYFLRDPSQWPQLWYVNGKVKNPHLIYPGEELLLVMVDGHPRLSRRGAIERLSPQVREAGLDQGIPAIPIDAIRAFLQGPRVVSDEEIQRAPYVLAFVGEHINGAGGDGIYVRKLKREAFIDYQVVQIGEAYRDPDNGDLLGYEALPAGQAEIRNYGDPAEMVLNKSAREVLINDRLLPLETDAFNADFYPHAPLNDVNGSIIAVFDGISQIAQYQIVTLNRGSNAGLDPGAVLRVFQAGRRVPDPQDFKSVTLPEQEAGWLMVFKVSPKISYALVMNATRAIHLLDKVHKPIPQNR